MGYQLIETIEVGGSNVSSLAFTGIPQDGVDLVCRLSTRGSGTGTEDLRVQVNGVTSGYSWLYMGGLTENVQTGKASNYQWNVISFVSITNTSQVFTNCELVISNYTATQKHAMSADYVTPTDYSRSIVAMQAANTTDTAAITSLSIGLSGGSFVQYSTASLYKVTAD
jgi:hypothetical protein